MAVRDGQSVVKCTDISTECDVTISLLPLLHLTKYALKEKGTDVKMTAEIKHSILEQLNSTYDNDDTLQLMHMTTLRDLR